MNDLKVAIFLSKKEKFSKFKYKTLLVVVRFYYDIVISLTVHFCKSEKGRTV